MVEPGSLEHIIRILEQQLKAARAQDGQAKRPRLSIRPAKLAVIASGLLLAAAVTYLLARPNDPVPISIRNGANFGIYYPDSSKLPAGFSLVRGSFSLEAANQAVIYTISAPKGAKIIVSNQLKPTADQIQGFYKTHMPLTIQAKTSIGTASLGAISNEMVVSLPTTTNTWVLVTAPFNFNQTSMEQVVRSLTLSR